eukprot:3851849-Amphidinium_carterae.1
MPTEGANLRNQAVMFSNLLTTTTKKSFPGVQGRISILLLKLMMSEIETTTSQKLKNTRQDYCASPKSSASS